MNKPYFRREIIEGLTVMEMDPSMIIEQISDGNNAYDMPRLPMLCWLC